MHGVRKGIHRRNFEAWRVKVEHEVFRASDSPQARTVASHMFRYASILRLCACKDAFASTFAAFSIYTGCCGSPNPNYISLGNPVKGLHPSIC